MNVFLTHGRIDGAKERIQLLLLKLCIWFATKPSIAIETTSDWSFIDSILGMSGEFIWIIAPNLIKSHGISSCTSFKNFEYIWEVFCEIKLPLSRFNKNFRNFSLSNNFRFILHQYVQYGTRFTCLVEFSSFQFPIKIRESVYLVGIFCCFGGSILVNCFWNQLVNKYEITKYSHKYYWYLSLTPRYATKTSWRNA